jgi:hypothetical protein
MTTESRAAACAGITSWGIQAPSTRLGTEPFKEVVTSSDVVSFNKCFGAATEIIESVSMVDCYLTYMLETDEQANEIPQYAEEHGVTSYKLYMQTRSMKGMESRSGQQLAVAPRRAGHRDRRRHRLSRDGECGPSRLPRHLPHPSGELGNRAHFRGAPAQGGTQRFRRLDRPFARFPGSAARARVQLSRAADARPCAALSAARHDQADVRRDCARAR